MIIVIASIRARPETEARLIEICRAHSARSRKEDGCIAHNVHTDCEDPLRLVFVESWRDQAALSAHFALGESRDFVREVRDLAASAEPMRIFEVTDVTSDLLG